MALPSLAKRTPQGLGIASATGATLLGAVYLLLAQAPARYAAINCAALVIGLIVVMVGRQLPAMSRGTAGVAMLLSAAILPATALFGVSVDGAARWIAVGPLVVQPAMIVLPLIVMGFLPHRNAVTTAAMLVAALGLAMQPDRAMAAVLFAGLAAQAMLRFDRHVGVALIGSLVALVATFVRPDSLPAMPFVEHIYYSAFDAGLTAGLAVVGGTLLLLAPALAGMRLPPESRDVCLVFGAIWLAVIMAAAIGNYPTPVVGYSGAAVLGYVLSLLGLPSRRAG